MLSAIAAVYNVNREWIETGEGPMFNESALDRFSPAQKVLFERFTRHFCENVPVPDTEEAITVVNTLVDILMSDNEPAKKAVTASIMAFGHAVQDNEKCAKEDKKPSDLDQKPLPHKKGRRKGDLC